MERCAPPDGGQVPDTSRIQMHILIKLTETRGTIVVVGDDHQSIHRFRGASVANLLQFTRWFPGCGIVEFTTNYVLIGISSRL